MRRVLRLAKKGVGFVLPNPMVGALIVKDGQRIGEGYHEYFGGPHAEVNALATCTESPKGATLYVNLEPCDHEGKTPPCTRAIIEAGIAKVVIASRDPSRNGLESLKQAGVEVEVGLLEEEARILNRAFYTYHEKNRPFITLKLAITLDGKITKHAGSPTQVTGDLARKLTHVMRHEHHAILVGSGTLLSDNPHLGVREIEGRDPLRIVLKGDRPLPQELKVFRNENFIIIEDQTPKQIVKTLYDNGVTSVLIEGGAQTFSRFMDAQLWDEGQFFIGPHFFGQEALSAYLGISAHSLKFRNMRQCGPDLLVTATPWDLDHS